MRPAAEWAASLRGASTTDKSAAAIDRTAVRSARLGRAFAGKDPQINCVSNYHLFDIAAESSVTTFVRE